METMSSNNIFTMYIVVILLLFSTPTNQQKATASGEILQILNTARKLVMNGHWENKQFPYSTSSIPMRLYECLQNFTMLRCTKTYVLQKLEENPKYIHTDNLRSDFIQQFFGNETVMGSLVDGRFHNMSDKQLNQRLTLSLQRFFKKRDLKFNLMNSLLIKIVPSKENKLKFSLRKATKSKDNTKFGRALTRADGDENVSIAEEGDLVDADMKRPAGGMMKKKKKTNYKYTMLQMAVPVMILPAILMGSFLPFVLPMLKMATIMSLLMNNSAFLAALLYAARTHANAQDEQVISYGPPGYH